MHLTSEESPLAESQLMHSGPATTVVVASRGATAADLACHRQFQAPNPVHHWKAKHASRLHACVFPSATDLIANTAAHHSMPIT
jgi:hypothetical protein